MLKNISELESNRIILFLILLILLPYLLLSLYCHPAADDFEGAASSILNGFWNSYFRDLGGFNGRYTDGLFAFASPLRWGSILSYKLFPILLMCISYYALLFFFKTLFPVKISLVRLHLFAAATMALYLYNAPSITETFYWYSSAVTYQLPAAMTLVYFSLLYRFIEKKYYSSKKINLILILVLAMVIIGFNEVIMLLMLVSHLFFFHYSIQLKKKNKNSFVVILFFVLACSSLMIFSPGNAGRLSNFPEHHLLLHSFYRTALQMLRFTCDWVFQIPFICATILFIPVCRHLNETKKKISDKFYISPLIVFAALPFVLFISIFPAYWSMGILGQHRTLNTACFFFIPLWFMNIYLLASRFSPIVTAYISKYRIVLIVIFLMSLSLTNNGYIVLSDLFSGRAAIFNSEMFHRYELIKSGSETSKDEVIIENPDVRPKSLYLYDISCDPDFWINHCYEDYFNVKRIRLRKCE
jgi:hypothetical protein